ncbi:hypothetical protein CRG98_048227, partial [Punica granatum]
MYVYPREPFQPELPQSVVFRPGVHLFAVFSLSLSLYLSISLSASELAFPSSSWPGFLLLPMEANAMSLRGELHLLSPAARFRRGVPQHALWRSPSIRHRLKSRSSSIISASSSTTESESVCSPSSDRQEAESGSSSRVNPVYSPTPPNRELRTPHSGYHFDGTTRKFFEGWYFKVSIPEVRQSFCFMYSVESPAFTKKLSAVEVAQYGPRFTGVGAQILGADDKYICQYSEDSSDFWGSRHELMLGNTFISAKDSKPPNKEVPPQ